MQSDYLITVGEKLVRRYGTRDPFAIADGLGILVKECPDFGPLKGMYTIIKRNRYIFLNNQLDEVTRRIVCAHEIGHDQLHRDLVKNGALREFTLYDMQSTPEYEANIVCAELLLDTEEVLSYIYREHYTAAQIARIMHTDINLVALKVAHLDAVGYRLHPQEFRSDFLRQGS
ncbi:MAG: ImmA/IrrE family metallo-endopeptidase [Eubacteriales bacterium]|nr:ImmA/IrrE family metallo-endopeptidase [Eubacteriales bacterium]